MFHIWDSEKRGGVVKRGRGIEEASANYIAVI